LLRRIACFDFGHPQVFQREGIVVRIDCHGNIRQLYALECPDDLGFTKASHTSETDGLDRIRQRGAVGVDCRQEGSSAGVTKQAVGMSQPRPLLEYRNTLGRGVEDLL